MTTGPRRQPWRVLTVVIGSLLALVVGVVLRPTAHSLPEDEHGDPELAASIRELTGGRPSAAPFALTTMGRSIRMGLSTIA